MQRILWFNLSHLRVIVFRYFVEVQILKRSLDDEAQCGQPMEEFTEYKRACLRTVVDENDEMIWA